MGAKDKLLVWLYGEVKTPPFSRVARVDSDAIVILEVFKKGTAKTPLPVINTHKRRLRMYDDE